jgi:hypothetical protein
MSFNSGVLTFLLVHISGAGHCDYRLLVGLDHAVAAPQNKRPHPNLNQTGWDVAKNLQKTKDGQNYSRNCSWRLSSEIELQSKLHTPRIVNRSQDPPQIGTVNVPDSGVKP